MTNTSGYSLTSSMSKLIYDPRIGELSPFNDEEIFFDSTKRDFHALFKDDFDYFFRLFEKVRSQVTTDSSFTEQDIAFFYRMNIDKEPQKNQRSAELFFCRKDNQEVFCSFSFKLGLNGEVEDIIIEMEPSVLSNIKVKNFTIERPKNYKYTLSGLVTARIQEYDEVRHLSLRLDFKNYNKVYSYPEQVCFDYTFDSEDKFSVHFYSSDETQKNKNIGPIVHYGRKLILSDEQLMIPLRIAAILVSQKSFNTIEDIFLLPAIEEGRDIFYEKLSDLMMTETSENLDKKQTVLEMVNYD